MTNSKTQIIAFVGMPGSGKSTAVEHVSKKGYPKVYFGGIIYDAMREAGIEITPESQTTFREEIRQREGKDFVAKRIIAQLNNLIEAGQHRIIADSIYSWTEYKTLKRAFPGEITVIGVLAPRYVRHRRLAARPERPFTGEEARVRDWREIEELEKGGPIAVADHYIINDSTSIETYTTEVDRILDEVNFYQ